MHIRRGPSGPHNRKRWGMFAAAVACATIIGSGGYAIAAGTADEASCEPGASVLIPKVAMNIGGPEVTAGGKTWSADQYGTGGHVWTNPASPEVADTDLDAVYKSERAAKQFTYNIPVENGTYLVRLHMAEIYWKAKGGSAANAKPGKRLQTINVEGGFPEVRGHDPAVVAKSTLKAVPIGVETAVADGKLTVTGFGHTDFAALQGLEAFLMKECSAKGEMVDAEPEPTVAPTEEAAEPQPTEDLPGETDGEQPAGEEGEQDAPAEQPAGEAPEGEAPEGEAPGAPVPAAPVVGAKGVVMAAGQTPSDPNAERVVSPNPSPVAKAANLKGPRIRIGCGDSPEKLNGMNLTPGTVVEFERGCQWMNVRVYVKGNGTADQPILLTGVGDASKPAPVFSAQKGGNGKDGGVIELQGANMHLSGVMLKDAGSIGIRVSGANGVLDNIEAANVVSGAWITGDGTKVWNSYFHNLRMMPDTPGSNDDYGANGLTVEAANVTIEGLTCRMCLARSADYDQYGGDGSFVEVWNKGENLKVAYGYVDQSARVLEAGGIQGQSARNMSLRYVFAKGITDSPIYLNPGGDYGGIDTSGFTQSNNSIN